MIKIFGNIEKELKYYDLNKYLKEIINDLTANNPIEKEKFEKFSKNYSVFEPYFDYAMKNLNIYIENPIFFNNKCLILKDKHYYIENIDNIENLEKKNLSFYDMVTCDDKMLGLNMISELADGCIIDCNGNWYELCMTPRHLHIARAVLNQHLGSNVSDYRKYKEFVIEHGIYHIVDFIIDYLGYIYVKYSSPVAIYNINSITNIQFKALQKIKRIHNVSKEEIIYKRR